MIPARQSPDYRSSATLTFVLAVVLLFCTLSAFGQRRIPMVVVEEAAETELVEEVSLTGTVVSPRIANLSTEVSGIVDRMDVEIGDHVGTGNPILRLNSDLNQLSLTAARAETNQAAEELSDSRRRLANARRLVKSRSLSVNEVETLAAKVRINAAVLERYKAVQERQEAQLERYTLYAPFDGIISQKQVEQGEWLSPGQSVVELVASEGLLIELQAPQSMLSKLGKVAEIYITLEAMPGETLGGTIQSVIPVVNPATRTFLIRAVVSNANAPLAPGMSASARLNLSAGNRGIAVSRDALIRYPDGRITVWIIEQEDDQVTVRERRVELGAGFEGKIAVTNGLSPGAQVVVRGNEALREGQKVTIKPTD